MITALIPTYNCEKYIRNCLESIKWADHIFIIDSFSTDSTLEICSQYTDWIIQHEYINSATQKNWALKYVETEWVLQIDSDEVVEIELAAEIQQLLKNPSIEFDGFKMPRKNFIWGRWIKTCGIYPDSQLRLFKAKNGTWSQREVHAHVIGLEQIGHLNNHILHHDLTSVSDELSQFANQVIEWETNELIKAGKAWSWADAILRPIAIFLLLYFRKGGFRDGYRGFYLSVYRAFYTLMVYAKLYEWEMTANMEKMDE